MKLLKLTKDAYNQYKNTVKGNENISYKQAQRKLTRNVQLAIEAPQEEEHKQQDKKLYLYGNLHILVVQDRIVWVKNHRWYCDWFHKDQEEYEELSKKYKIPLDEELEQSA